MCWGEVVLHQDLPIAPGALKGPRAAILFELKRAQRLTANDLAAKLNASLNSVRHHLKELEAEQLIEYDRERRGVGAPVFAYRLTAQGEALFPRRYEGTLLQLLDQVARRDGRAAAASMLEAQFETIADRLAPSLAGATNEERIEHVTRALADEGFMAEWTRAPAGGEIVAHNCAILSVAERFPEVCDAERRFLSRTLGATVERRSHILGGCGACQYTVCFERGDTVTNKEM